MMRLWRWLEWRQARARFLSAHDDDGRAQWSIADEDRRAMVRRLPALPPYARLAEHYFRFSASFCPRYEDLLAAVGRRFRFEIRDVLDVACGAGTLTARLAKRFETVVGFDVCEPMLACARRECAALENVRIVNGDYHTFALGERVDAAVCACDSLNYIERIEDLAVVLRRVAAHLRPGGFFAFDVLDAYSMRIHALMDMEYEEAGVRFAMCTDYDAYARQERTYVAFADGVETHARIPVSKWDVTRTAREAGFAVVAAFSDAHAMRWFYVLRIAGGQG
jgi:trans-aconitate methyltransferase